jgi:hypothetical protein
MDISPSEQSKKSPSHEMEERQVKGEANRDEAEGGMAGSPRIIPCTDNQQSAQEDKTNLLGRCKRKGKGVQVCSSGEFCS